MAETELSKMEGKETVLQGCDISGLVRDLVQLDEGEQMASKQYCSLRKAMEGKQVLNLNGVLNSYTGTDRMRALTLIFHLVDSLSIDTLLLQRNGIDAATLAASLQKFGTSHDKSQLSTLRVLDLTGNNIGKGNNNAREISPLTKSRLDWKGVLRRSKKLFPRIKKSQKQVPGDSFAPLACAICDNAFPRLQSLSLSKNPMSSDDMEQLASCFTSLPELKLLRLRAMSSAAIVSLMSAWKGTSSHQLEEIDLCESDLNGQGVAALCGMERANIRRVILTNTGISADDCIVLADAIKRGKLGALESIDLSFNQNVGDAGLCALARCNQERLLPSLREISLAHSGIGSDGVGALAVAIESGCLTSLEKLDLSQNKIASKALVSLANTLSGPNVTQLKQLCLQRTGLEDDVVVKLVQAVDQGCFPQLEELNLSGNVRLTNSSMELLLSSIQTGHLLQLRELRLSDTGLQDETVIRLAEAISEGNLQRLEQLDLSLNWKLTDRSMMVLANSLQTGQVIHLRELILTNTELQDTAVLGLAEAMNLGSLPVLERLNLSGNLGLTSKSMALLATSFHTGHATHLKELVLSFIGLKDAAVVKLAEAIGSGKLQKLERLDLSWNPTLNRSLVLLANSFRRGRTVHLRELVLSNTHLQDDALIELARAISMGHLRALERLNLSGNLWLTSKSMVLFATSFSKEHVIPLRELVLSCSALHDDAVMKLAEAMSLGNLQALERLDLSGNCNLTSKSMVPLANSFRRGSMTHLKELGLSYTGLHDAALVKLAEAITSGNLQALERLDLSRNWNLTSKSMVLLATSICRGRMIHLRELGLSDNKLQDDAVAKLAEAISLGSLRALVRLDLSGNWNLTSESMVLLANSFHKGYMMHLRELVLSDIGLEDDVVVELAEAIVGGSLRALERLDLSYNPMLTSKSMSLLANSFRSGHMMHLRELILSYTGLEDDAVVGLAEAMSKGNLRALERLDLSQNWELTSESMVLLATSFRSGRSIHLRELVLSCTGLQDKAVVKLAEVIRLGKLQGLEKLYLWGQSESTYDALLHLSASLNTKHMVRLRDVFVQGHGQGATYYVNRVDADNEACASQFVTRREHGLGPNTLDNVKEDDEPDKGVEVNWSSESEPDSKSDSMPEVELESTLEECSAKNHVRVGVEEIGDKWDRGAQDTRPRVNIATCPDESVLRREESGGAEEEEIAEDGKMKHPHTSMHETLELRSDVQGAGFSSWDQRFNPGQILVLCDVLASKEEACFLFFHAEGMASVFGVGLSHSKVSLRMRERKAIVEEMPEDSWRQFWLGSYEGAFKLVLLETSETEEVSQTFEKLHLSKDEALSRFGMTIDGPRVLEFVRTSQGKSDSTSQQANCKAYMLPRWMGWVKLVIDVVNSGAETPKDGLQKSEQDLVKSLSQGSQPKVADAADEGEQGASLVVVVMFLAVACPMFKCGFSEEIEWVDNVGHLKALSSIRPRLTMEFCRDMKGNYVTADLRGEFQISRQKAPLLARWNQDDLRLSFEPSEEGKGECYLDETHVKSKVEIKQIETTLQVGGLRSAQDEVNVQGNLAMSGFGVQVSKRHGVSCQSSEKNQRKSMISMTVLADFQFFGISNNSVGDKMEYCASCVDSKAVEGSGFRSDAKGSGLQSNVDMAVEGKYYLFGANINTYEFQAEKELSRRASIATTSRQLDLNGWVNDENRPCSWGFDSKNAFRGSGGEIRDTLANFQQKVPTQS